MAVEFVYLDESYDASKFAMAAIIVPDDSWHDAFARVKAARQRLKEKHGIFTSKELHATDFVAGRGRIADRIVPKAVRAQIFRQFFEFIPTIPGVRVLGGAWNNAGRSLPDTYAHAFRRLQDRLQRRCSELNRRAVIISDEGQENELTRAARRAKVYNPVGSRFGAWSGGKWKNIPTDRIIEDPIFKPSHQSYFLQVADFVAFALLKRESPNRTPRTSSELFDQQYERLDEVLIKEASHDDPLGIVRS